jgi:hypothetical protein
LAGVLVGLVKGLVRASIRHHVVLVVLVETSVEVVRAVGDEREKAAETAGAQPFGLVGSETLRS